MSARGIKEEKSWSVLLPEDDVSEKIPSEISQDVFYKIPDIILFGENLYDEDFPRESLSKFGKESEKPSSRGTTRKSSFGEFWEQYEGFPVYISVGQEEEDVRKEVAEEEEEKEEEEEEEEEEEDEEEEVSYSDERKKKVKAMSDFEPWRRSLFVHSSPSHFPDINRARKSVFGSIFVRTTGYLAEEAALLKSVADRNYNMLQSLLSSFDRILSSTSADSYKRKTALAYRESVIKSLEMHGISRTYSDGSVRWEIYPVTQNYLFSIQLGDRVHQTRYLSRIEDRIATGTTQFLKPLFSWPTESSWLGHWDTLGMAGHGEYSMPHGVSYSGHMQNGMFQDDDATLTYPNKFKALHCVYKEGQLLDCQFQFPDKLMHEKTNWGYCKFPDRRFWSEVVNGLKPAKTAQKTELDPPRRIPLKCYDTSDGFYNPKTLMLVSPAGELLRVPVCKEDLWIKKYCRKAVPEPANFRPDLFENWFNYDKTLIKSILDQQEMFRAGKISYEELQQFYANHDLSNLCSKYKKMKSPSQVAVEEYINSLPNPKGLKLPRTVKKYQGHDLPVQEELEISENPARKITSITEGRTSKSFQILNKEYEFKSKMSVSQAGMLGKGSKISFRLGDGDEVVSDVDSDLTDGGKTDVKRKVPEQFMRNQPILRLKQPFPEKPKFLQEERSCARQNSNGSSGYWDLEPEGGSISFSSLQRKGLIKFMKNIIMDIVTKILKKERERHRARYLWGKKVSKKPSPRENPNEKCLKVLQELFTSIPDREEYGDSDPDKTAYFRKLAEDKYNILKYWGKRMFTMKFSDGIEI